MTEWRAIPGHEGYEASDEGQVRSLRGTPEGRVLNQSCSPSSEGYRRVSVRTDAGAYRSVGVHRLVAAAFYGPRPEGMQTRHLDGNKSNNKLANLAYGTPSQNNRDQVAHGVNPYAARDTCANGHPWNAENTWLELRACADGVVSASRRCRACWRKNTAAYAARRRKRAA